ncbi:MAG: glycosyltransferase family 4 protein [Candidatus Tectomicrobia bacterium]|nr:glycosyltransferase family 4 protein [Candidatus Tectomicrobia bacterium]
MPVRSMKLLTFTEIFPTQEHLTAGIFVGKLVEALAALCEVEVIVPQPWSPFARRERVFTRCENYRGIPVYKPRLFVLPRGDRLSFRGLPFLFAALALLIRKKKWDFHLIHAHMAAPAGFAGVLLGKLLRKPVVITVHGSDIHTYPQYPLLGKMVRFSLKHADKVVAVSQALASQALALGVSQEQLAVVYNGVDLQLFQRLDREAMQRRLGLTGQQVLLFVGLLISRKAPSHLLQAFKTLVNSHSNLLLVIIGEGELEGKLREQCQRDGIEKRVWFVGTRPHEELPCWMGAADLLCLPSLHEGLPQVVLEALACGLPVVATAVDGTPEAIRDDTVGLLVPPGDPEQLARALREALSRVWDREAIAEYGKRFSWRETAEHYMMVFESLCNSI